MKFLNQFIFVVLFVTLAVLVCQSYSLPSVDESEMAEIEEARIVKRGILDCPHNCWGSILRRDLRCSNPADRFVANTFLACFCCRHG